VYPCQNPQQADKGFAEAFFQAEGLALIYERFTQTSDPLLHVPIEFNFPLRCCSFFLHLPSLFLCGYVLVFAALRLCVAASLGLSLGLQQRLQLRL
jgi:hypothetical protein